MYPQRELIGLAAHKATLCRRIARQRLELVEAAGCVARPLAWLDRAVALWRRFSPLALIVLVRLGFLLKRRSSPRLKWLGAIMKWAPLIFGLVRGVGAARQTRRSR